MVIYHIFQNRACRYLAKFVQVSEQVRATSFLNVTELMELLIITLRFRFSNIYFYRFTFDTYKNCGSILVRVYQCLILKFYQSVRFGLRKNKLLIPVFGSGLFGSPDTFLFLFQTKSKDLLFKDQLIESD